MVEQHILDREIITKFVNCIDDSIFEELLESYLDEPALLYDEDGAVDKVTAFESDYAQRCAFGEISEVSEYLCELCINIEDVDLRDKIIEEFDLDRDYIEEEL